MIFPVAPLTFAFAFAVAVSARSNRREDTSSTDPLLSSNSVGSDCAPAGPDFPAPRNLSTSPLVTSAAAEFQALLNNGSLGLTPNDTAFSVAMFSSKENKTVYEYYYTPEIDIGVPSVDRDSVFRIASISKVFTVWAFLVGAGDASFNDPITKYVPELAQASASPPTDSNVVYDDINDVRWEDVTLGNLASQSAGIPRDGTTGDLSSLPLVELDALGIPPLDQSEIPSCGVNETTAPCDRQEFFSYLLKQHPVFPTSHSPAYSNLAFTLLGYALGNITGKDLNSTMQENIFEPLGMTHSSFSTPPPTGGVIPGDPVTAGWLLDLGESAAAGAVYMSTADMVTAGMAILQSVLLSPAETRRWFMPHLQTGHSGNLVGAPWEISSLESPNNRLIQYLTKQGDQQAYHSAMVLSPEHEVGWVVLTGGTSSSSAPAIRTTLMNAFGEIFMPAVEAQSQVEAGLNFNGTYTDPSTNSSITIAAGNNGHSGLTVLELISNGVELFGASQSPAIAALGGSVSSGASGDDVNKITQMFPTALKTISKKSDSSETYESRLGFRMVFFSQGESGLLNDACLDTWTVFGAPLYGQRSLDDVVFNMGEDGAALTIELRMLRLTLAKQA